MPVRFAADRVQPKPKSRAALDRDAEFVIQPRSDITLIHFNRFRLQIAFCRFQATPPSVTEQPERFARQFPSRSLHRSLTQRRVKNVLRFARVAEHQETKAIKLWQILFSFRHARCPRKTSRTLCD